MAGCIGGGGNGDDTADGGSVDTDDDGTTADSSSGGSESVDVTPWTAYNADAERTRSTPDQLPETLDELASFELPVRSGSGPNPVVTGDGVFLIGVEGNVIGLNHTSLDKRFERSLSVQGGYVDDGAIVASGDDNVLGLEVTDGERRWVASREGRVFPTTEGVGYIGGGGLGVIEPDTGEFDWQNELNLPDTRRPPVHTDSGTVFVDEGSGTEEIVGIDTETGDELWRFAKESKGELDADPTPFAVQDGTVFVHDVDGFIGLDRTDGSLRWERRGGKWRTRGYAYAVDGDGLYIWTTRDEIRAVEPSDGTELWTASLVGGLQGVTTGVGANGVVYTTGNRIEIRSKANGDSKLSEEVDGANRVAIAGGRLYTTQTNSSADRILTTYGQN